MAKRASLRTSALWIGLMAVALVLDGWVPIGFAVKEAQAVVGRPMTPGSVAGVARRTTRRTIRRSTIYATTLPAGCTHRRHRGDVPQVLRRDLLSALRQPIRGRLRGLIGQAQTDQLSPVTWSPGSPWECRLHRAAVQRRRVLGEPLRAFACIPAQRTPPTEVAGAPASRGCRRPAGTGFPGVSPGVRV